ncbi:hypothetical protein [Tepidimonas charontis]|uniref:Flagellar protein FliT n=1 Tax=Tepidimonas charontis TaxID=2267262 RepID=A0A554XG92_9BURK|nr:hypothetical protein [Tepidimonas charontis]TSE34799.1 hypothetical protein Tchar_01152 [Tepidimonas charontis]
MTATADVSALMKRLRAQLDDALALAAQHAGGAADAQAWVDACAALARTASELRPWLTQAGNIRHDDTTARLLSDIGTRMQTLLELHTRLEAANRQALSQLLPQDTLQAYARLGRSARSGAYR